mmetsp:Transcript_27468/g.68959  ORF Transcript_27468/g.68959 Transcript_27468/m.68959 type:complete len:168 (-) Transcript_27468:81-584(-)
MSLTAGAIAFFHRYWDVEEDSAESADAPHNQGSMTFIPRILKVTALSDSYMVGCLLGSIHQPLTVPLRTWVVGGLLLSFPATALTHYVTKRWGVRTGFVVEVAIMGAGFLWLSYGTMLLSSASGDVRTAPLLWWSCFVQCIFTWSLMTTGIASMILMTVLSLLISSK